MKKAILLITLLVCLCALPCIGASADFDLDRYEVTSQEQQFEVYCCASGFKSGSYTYYFDAVDNSTLMRVKAGGQAKKLAENVSTFFLADKKVFYTTLTDEETLYVMDRDGKNSRAVVENYKECMAVKDGYVYYVSTYGNCARVKLADGTRERLVKGNTRYSYAMYNDRLYFGVNKTKNGDSKTEYCVLKSVELDGSNVRVELKKAKGHYRLLYNDGCLIACNNRINTENTPIPYNWYILGEDGQWSEYITDTPIGNYIFMYNDGNVYFYTGIEREFAEAGLEEVTGFGYEVIYSADKNGKVTKLVDLKDIHEADTAYWGIYTSEGYLCAVSYSEENVTAIYIYDSGYNLIDRINLASTGSTGYAFCDIIKDKCYTVLVDSEYIASYYIIDLK